MYAKIAEGFHFHYMKKTGTISMWNNGRAVKIFDPTMGSRQFFKVGKYFIKAEYAHGDALTQCKDEAFFWGRVQKQDRQYFSPLLACSDMGQDMVLWNMFPWYNLKAYNKRDALFMACQKKINHLCEKYNLGDVAEYVNINWFIHKSKPLIVDCGCAGEFE